jgi:hypothetical protein
MAHRDDIPLALLVIRQSSRAGPSQSEGIVKRLLETPHIKRDDVKPDKKKPEKLIPPPPKF